MNKLKLTQVEIFDYFIFRVQLLMYPNCFMWPCKEIMYAFSNLSLLTTNIICMCTRELELMKSISSVRICDFPQKWVKLTQGELFSIFHFKIELYFLVSIYVLQVRTLFCIQFFKIEKTNPKKFSKRNCMKHFLHHKKFNHYLRVNKKIIHWWVNIKRYNLLQIFVFYAFIMN